MQKFIDTTTHQIYEFEDDVVATRQGGVYIFIAAHGQTLDVPATLEPYDGSSPEPAPQPVEFPRLTALEMLDLFTEAEQLAVVEATMTNAAVKLWYDRMIAATFVTYEDPRTEAGLQALVDAELITAERKADIVAAMQP